MLVKYNDKKTCERVNEGYSPILSLTDNAEPDCNRILQRAAWLPSYDAWVDRLSLPDPRAIPTGPQSISPVARVGIENSSALFRINRLFIRHAVSGYLFFSSRDTSK
jgi:hypothetical protein